MSAKKEGKVTEVQDWVEGSNLKQRELQAEALIWAANEPPTWWRIHDIHVPNGSEFETDWEYEGRKMEEHWNNRGIATSVMHLSLGRDNLPVPRWMSGQQKGLKLFEGSYLCLNEVPKPVMYVMTRNEDRRWQRDVWVSTMTIWHHWHRSTIKQRPENGMGLLVLGGLLTRIDS